MTILESMRKVVDNTSHNALDKFAKEMNTDSNTTLDIAMPIAGQAADYVTTIMALNRGYEEGNPFIKSVVRNQPVFFGMKAGISALMAYNVHRLHKNGNHKAAKVASVLGMLVGAGPAINNVIVMSKGK